MGDHDGKKGQPERLKQTAQEKERELAQLRQRLLRPELPLPASSRAKHERDHALVLDLMEYFCYAIKVSVCHHSCLCCGTSCPFCLPL